MNGKVAFVVGAAVGYVLGTRAGRERYEQIRSSVRSAFQHPAVRDKVEAAESAITEAVREQGAQVTDKVAGMVKERFSGSTAAGGQTASNGPDSAWDTPRR
jgi:hypothetical protein